MKKDISTLQKGIHELEKKKKIKTIKWLIDHSINLLGQFQSTVKYCVSVAQMRK